MQQRTRANNEVPGCSCCDEVITGPHLADMLTPEADVMWLMSLPSLAEALYNAD